MGFLDPRGTTDETPEAAQGRIFEAIKPWLPAFKKLEDLIIYFCEAPTRSVLPYMRSKVGYRAISLFTIYVQFWFFVILAVWGTLFGAAHVAMTRTGTESVFNLIDIWPFIYGVGFLLLALWQRRRRWDEIMRAQMVFTYSRGVSHLRRLFNIRRPDFVERFADPAVLFLAAIVMVFLSKIMALWFLYCAICTLVVEQLLADKVLNRMLDTMDSLLLNEVNTQEFRAIQAGRSEAEALRTAMEAANARGFVSNPHAEDIQRAIARRKQREAQERGEAGEGEEERAQPATATAPRTINPWIILLVVFALALITEGYFLLRKKPITPAATGGQSTSELAQPAAIPAQPLTLAGKWNGTITQANGAQMLAVLTLQQNNANLAGTLLKEYPDQPLRYVITRVRGIVTPGGGISLQEFAIVRKSPGSNWCLEPLLQLSPQNNDQALGGRWPSHGACPGGSMTISR